eukprot:CAMPEP_0119013804 /NCGR_PEP_ID=MMETSP1176-20130426/9002_1 /TAXON_ID=265551 /ORGANISM="Synedropsis recta cf, Strain CCMP1620" /LENGTH=112 /DNA_ID=CAMNT_0006966923 /DNA_START=68 /DNA_END=406 /DNA_ORIENTATION=-
MVSRILIVLILAVVALSANAFAPRPSFTGKSVSFGTALEGCRVNAKKEKIKRNRENMRKFKTTGKRGTSRRKTLKKLQANKARQEESEFISKCFTTVPPPANDQANEDNRRR